MMQVIYSYTGVSPIRFLNQDVKIRKISDDFSRTSDFLNSDFWLTASANLRREKVDSKDSLTLNTDSCDPS